MWDNAMLSQGELVTRKATCKILEMVEEGLLDKDMVILSCLNWMSEADVKEMAHANEMKLFPEEEEEDDDN